MPSLSPSPYPEPYPCPITLTLVISLILTLALALTSTLVKIARLQAHSLTGRGGGIRTLTNIQRHTSFERSPPIANAADKLGTSLHRARRDIHAAAQSGAWGAQGGRLGWPFSTRRRAVHLVSALDGERPGPMTSASRIIKCIVLRWSTSINVMKRSFPSPYPSICTGSPGKPSRAPEC